MVRRWFAVGCSLLLAWSWAVLEANGADQPPVPKVEIVSPKAGTELSGEVAVTVQVSLPEGTRAPDDFYRS